MTKREQELRDLLVGPALGQLIKAYRFVVYGHKGDGTELKYTINQICKTCNIKLTGDL